MDYPFKLFINDSFYNGYKTIEKAKRSVSTFKPGTRYKIVQEVNVDEGIILS